MLKNWNNAQLHCESQYQAKLVIIANEDEQLALKAYLETVTQGQYGFVIYYLFIITPDGSQTYSTKQ